MADPRRLGETAGEPNLIEDPEAQVLETAWRTVPRPGVERVWKEGPGGDLDAECRGSGFCEVLVKALHT